MTLGSSTRECLSVPVSVRASLLRRDTGPHGADSAWPIRTQVGTKRVHPSTAYPQSGYMSPSPRSCVPGNAVVI